MEPLAMLTMDDLEDVESLLLFSKEEEEEFMVVPTLTDSPITLEDLMLDETFNGLTVDILQNPSVAFVVDTDHQRQGLNHNSIASTPITSSASSFSNQLLHNGGGGGASSNIFCSDRQQQSTINFDGQQQFQFQTYSSEQQQQYQQYSAYGHFDKNATDFGMMDSAGDLNDPTSNWVAQTADVALLEHFIDMDQSTAEIVDNRSIDTSSRASILDKDQILREIYREAEEIDSRRDSPAVWSPQTHTASPIGGSGDQSMTCDSDDRSSTNDRPSIDGGNTSDSSSQYHPQLLVNFDHSFVVKKSRSTDGQQQEIDFSNIDRSSNIEIDGDQLPGGKKPKKEAAKQKKRHQNREAALRYRLKKRTEKDKTGEELSVLMERNGVLKTQKSNLSSEIAYLKGLLSEVQKKKQLR